MIVVCALCLGHGNPEHMLEQEIAEGSTTYVHGRCFIEANGLPCFLALPDEQTGRCEVGDIGVVAAKALLADRAAALLAKRAVAKLLAEGVLVFGRCAP